MDALEQFISVYKQLGKENLSSLRAVYSDDVRFCDPIHTINGIDSLIDYFTDLYATVDAVGFDFGEPISAAAKTAITWTMGVHHPRLNGGKMITVEGISCLHFNPQGQVCYHRDYFDLGALLYEQVPLLGRIVKKIKERMAP